MFFDQIFGFSYFSRVNDWCFDRYSVAELAVAKFVPEWANMKAIGHVSWMAARKGHNPTLQLTPFIINAFGLLAGRLQISVLRLLP